jgi:hypothetical protein
VIVLAPTQASAASTRARTYEPSGTCTLGFASSPCTELPELGQIIKHILKLTADPLPVSSG